MSETLQPRSDLRSRSNEAIREFHAVLMRGLCPRHDLHGVDRVGRLRRLDGVARVDSLTVHLREVGALGTVRLAVVAGDRRGRFPIDGFAERRRERTS